MHKLIVFDVDGTLVETASGATFRKSASDWHWLPGRLETCKQVRAQGVRLALATNQAGVAFSYSKFTEAEMQQEIEATAQAIGAEFVGVCYTTPNEKALPQYRKADDTRRKPGPGMLLEAMAHYGIDPQETLFVGDRPEDQQAAAAAGVAFAWAPDFFATK